MDPSIVPIVAIVVSGIVGVAGVILNFLKRTDADALARASRRTTALQLLSDEELTLEKVREEVRSFESIVEANKSALGDSYAGLTEASNRTTNEALEMLRGVRNKRNQIEPRIQTMAAEEIETIIAQAYHGKTRAEGQLYRTRKSKEDTISIYLGAKADSDDA